MLRSPGFVTRLPGTMSARFRMVSCRRASRVSEACSAKPPSSTGASPDRSSTSSMCALVWRPQSASRGLPGLVVIDLAADLHVAQAPPVDDVEPKLAAGVEHIQPQIHPVAQLLKDVDVERRHGRQAKDMGGFRQAEAAGGAPCRFDHPEEAGGGMLPFGPQLNRDHAPQRGLPRLVFHREACLTPDREPSCRPPQSTSHSGR
jgi:hypothetical protein